MCRIFFTQPMIYHGIFVIIGSRIRPTEVLEEAAFPLPGGMQYADRRTFLCDAVREYGTRSKLTGCHEISTRLDLPFASSLDRSRRGPHARMPLPPGISQERPSPSVPASIFDSPVHHVERACRITPLASGIVAGKVRVPRTVVSSAF